MYRYFCGQCANELIREVPDLKDPYQLGDTEEFICEHCGSTKPKPCNGSV